MKIIHATESEKRDYLTTKPVHPLFGWVTLRTGVTLPVEYLGEGRGEPNYEVLAPDGFHFAIEHLHTMLGYTQRDLLTRLRGCELEACGEDC